MTNKAMQALARQGWPKDGLGVEPILKNIEILETRHCSANGGLSSRSSFADLYPHGTLASEVTGPLERAVTIVSGNLPGTVHAEPIDQPSGTVGPMASGAYLAAVDSRFSEEVRRVLGGWFHGAVALHDRFETPEQYEALSR